MAILILILLLSMTNTQCAFRASLARSLRAKVEWYADRHPLNEDYVRVMIDTRGLPVNTVVSVDNMEITCDSAIGRVTRMFTPADFGNQFSDLSAGKVYEGAFVHSCPRGRAIKGKLMRITGKRMRIREKTLGAKGRPHREIPKLSYGSQRARKKPINVENMDIIVLSGVPTSERSRRK